VKKLLAIFSIVTVVTSLSLYQFNFKEVNRDLKPKCRYEKNTKILNDTAFEMKVLDVPFSYAYGIGLDDFNGDGLKDISVADAVEETFSLLTQNTDGSFSKNVIANIPGWYERHKIIHEDGKPVFWVVKNRSGQIVKISKTSNEWKEEEIVSEEFPFDISLGDINGDNTLDFSVSTHAKGKLVRYLSDQKGSYKREVLADRLGYVKTVILEDMNEDQKLDTVSASSYLKEVFYIDENTRTKITIGKNLHNPMVGSAVDLDQDGDMDMAIAAGGNVIADNSCETGLFWFENLDGGTRWEKHAIHQGNKTGFEVISEDLDGDGDLDLVTSYYEDPAMVIWYENNLPNEWLGHFLTASYSTEGASQILTADMNNDGKQDIVTAWADKDSRIIIFYQK
tara:strand:+ start:681362 stop:682543 length:1182 start_codon:yes stop_codon:yes gene_type:complete